jgi:hypothetical protein
MKTIYNSEGKYNSIITSDEFNITFKHYIFSIHMNPIISKWDPFSIWEPSNIPNI